MHQALPVFARGKGPPLTGDQGLKDPVTNKQPVIKRRDASLIKVTESTIEPDECRHFRNNLTLSTDASFEVELVSGLI